MVFSVNAQAKSVQLILNWKPEPQFGGFYAAQIQDNFKKKKLDVQIIPGGAGTPTIQMIAAGKAEYGIVSGEELLVSRARGSDLIALFAVYQKNPVGIMAHAEEGFHSIQDVFRSKGLLAVQNGLPYFLYLEKKLGKPQAKIVPDLGGITHFLNNPHYSQQVFITSEPLLAQKNQVHVSVFPVSEEGYNPYLTVVATRKAYLEKNRDQVKAFIQAIREGWKTYLETPEETNRFMHHLNPSMDLDTFARSAKAQKPLIEIPETQKMGLGQMTKERWKTLSLQSKQLGLTDQVFEGEDLFINF